MNAVGKVFMTFVLSRVENDKSAICYVFSALTNSFARELLAGVPKSRCNTWFQTNKKGFAKTSWLRTLFRSPDNLILPRIAEVLGGIGVLGDSLKIKTENATLFVSIMCNW